MKTMICALILSFSVTSLAADKVCFFSRGEAGSKGEHFSASITKADVTIPADSQWSGTYPKSKADSVKGKDGKTYLNYDITGGSDGCDTLLVDEDLLSAEGTGYIKFRCRGEGFDENIYFCHDDKK